MKWRVLVNILLLRNIKVLVSIEVGWVFDFSDGKEDGILYKEFVIGIVWVYFIFELK